ncbi:MAG: hypothetical protein JSR39_06270 [Verrucomicrobia bacterium]|nr:hypothetical protein [Verrucomicrobiota bacterium]
MSGHVSFGTGMPSFDHVSLISTRVRAEPVLSDQEKAYMNAVIALPLETILDNGDGEKRCKDLGQQIFDHFKQAAGADSNAGIEAMRKIADSLPFQGGDGRDRKEYVIRAWDRVGDANAYWMH